MMTKIDIENGDTDDGDGNFDDDENENYQKRQFFSLQYSLCCLSSICAEISALGLFPAGKSAQVC